MAYSPKDPTIVQSVDELKDFVREELHQIAREFGETTLLNLRPVYRAPDRPREGMILYADGTHFDPGSGVGLYVYKAGVWTFIA